MRGGGGGVPNHPRMALSLPSIVVLLRTLHACNPTWCVVFDSSIMTPCRQPTRVARVTRVIPLACENQSRQHGHGR